MRSPYHSEAYNDVITAMVEAYRKWGGIEAEETGMVNVSGEMTKAVLKIFQDNDCLNDKGREAIKPPER